VKVLVTGASGFIGGHLSRRLASAGHEVLPVGRTPGRGYDWSEASLERGVAAADAIVHLAGENIGGGRWTAARKRRIIDSRVQLTTRLARLAASRRPQCFVSASAVGFYPTSETETYDETSPSGSGFLAEVCRAWEAATAPASAAGVRTAIVRTAIVLGKDGGALPKMALPVKLFVGGPVGSGRQWMSWIHVEDLANLYLAILENPQAQGVFNATAPNPVTNAELTQALGRVLGRPTFMRVPAFVLRLALGEMAEMLLTGQRVQSRRVRELDFPFRYVEIEPALRAIYDGDRG
jgi:uncharacterized protein